MRCPTCEFEGEFKKAKPRFFVADIWESVIERDRARRSSVCPHCGTTIMLPAKPPGIVMTALLFLVVIGLAVGVAAFFWNQLH